MSKFIKKVLIFIGIFSFLFACIVLVDLLVFGNQYQGNYQAALLDKYDRIQELDRFACEQGKERCEKILLVGDSNLAFGMESEQIEAAMGMPVVNLGMHAGLGNAFLEQMAYAWAGEGDIVVVCHVDYGDDDRISDPKLALITLEFHKQLWELVRTKDIPGLLQAYPSYLIGAGVSWLKGGARNIPEEGSYSRAAFNKYGDIVVRTEDEVTFGEGSVEVPRIGETCVKRLNELNASLLERGATLLVAAYPIGAGEYTPAASDFDAFEEELREKLDCQVISHFSDYFIPYKYFAGTTFHVTQEGAAIRAGLLAEDLLKWRSDELH